MKVLQDYAKKEGNIRRAVENICGLFPDQFKAACKVFMVAFSSVIIREFERGATPDK
jgi:cytochrome oxidase Cu insertion factor (SCO1/SenC/PrrC family)